MRCKSSQLFCWNTRVWQGFSVIGALNEESLRAPILQQSRKPAVFISRKIARLIKTVKACRRVELLHESTTNGEVWTFVSKVNNWSWRRERIDTHEEFQHTCLKDEWECAIRHSHVELVVVSSYLRLKSETSYPLLSVCSRLCVKKKIRTCQEFDQKHKVDKMDLDIFSLWTDSCSFVDVSFLQSLDWKPFERKCRAVFVELFGAVSPWTKHVVRAECCSWVRLVITSCAKKSGPFFSNVPMKTK